jgi:shikimate dehydrogenase
MKPYADPERDILVARYGVVGDPIEHSQSPRIHQAFALATGQRLSYDKYHVTSENFASFARDFFAKGGSGLNVTVPHKIAAAELADALTPRARTAGAVNTLLHTLDGRLLGDNTDGAGLIADLARLRAPVTGARIVIIGAGGAVRGILGPLLDQHPAEVWIANRSVERAESLAEEFKSASRPTQILTCSLIALRDVGSADLLLQATPLGLQGQLPTLPNSLVKAHSFAYDLGYADQVTPFESWALAQGVGTAASGMGMLIEQAAEAFFVWRGVRPDTAALHLAHQSSRSATSNKR